MPLPTVAATLRWKMNTATKLKNAAMITAWYGLSTRVDTTVAIELAASWKPFMKSNASATTTSANTTPSPIWLTLPSTRPNSATSGVLEDEALDDVGHVLAAVGDRLEQVVDHAQLHHLLQIALLAEQLGQRRAHHAIGVGFEAVDLFAHPHDGIGALDVVQQPDHRRDALAAHVADVGELLG